jgi:hypothetical protein
MDVARKLLEGALGVVSLGFDAARHVAWFVSYQVDRTSREPQQAEESGS